MDNANIVAALASIRPSSTFIVLRGYRPEAGGSADYTINFHASYANALERSILAAEAFVPADDLEAQAKAEVLASYNASLDKVRNEPLEVVGDHYDRVLSEDGSPVKGIKLHRESGHLLIQGLLVRKTVREAAPEKKTAKRPLTVAKDKVRGLGPVSRWVTFRVDPAKLEGIAVEGAVLSPE